MFASAPEASPMYYQQPLTFDRRTPVVRLNARAGRAGAAWTTEATVQFQRLARYLFVAALEVVLLVGALGFMLGSGADGTGREAPIPAPAPTYSR